MAPKILALRIYGVQVLDLPHRFNYQCFGHTKTIYLWLCQLTENSAPRDIVKVFIVFFNRGGNGRLQMRETSPNSVLIINA